jgi:hypothetical protein
VDHTQAGNALSGQHGALDEDLNRRPGSEASLKANGYEGSSQSPGHNGCVRQEDGPGDQIGEGGPAGRREKGWQDLSRAAEAVRMQNRCQ